MNKYIKEILTKQCEIVGANYDDIDFKEPKWFMLYEWTEEQENEFIEWLIKYWKDNNEARQVMLRSNVITKKYLKTAAEQFVFNYGWKYKKL